MKKGFCALLVALVSILQMQPAFSQRAYEVSDFIETLEVGRPVYYENLTIIPVYAPRNYGSTNYVTLDEALGEGKLTISEMGGGRVSEVMLSNYSRDYIYIMGGEILTGCRQDRIIGRDVLIAPHRRNVVVPVYCVEEGRWTAKSDKFYSKNNLGTYELRGAAQRARADTQSSIWGSIRDFNQRLRVSSSTHAYQDAYDDKTVRSEVVLYERRFQRIPDMHRDTVGVVVAVGGEIVSADIFVSPQIFRKLWPKILRSSAFSTINCRNGGSVSQRRAADFLSGLRSRNYYNRSAIGLGEEFSAAGGVSVNALIYKNRVVHLAAFHEEVDYYDQRQRGSNRDRIPVSRR